jgi:hypothetical protein
MRASEFAEHLDGVNKHGDEYSAKCPAHEDDVASLSFRDGEDRILLKCHAGCTYEAIVVAADIKKTDLFHASGNSNGQRAASSREVATYAYRDESGNLLYEAVRFEPKSFRQRRPDDKGGWIWNLRDTRRVLYRLQDLQGQKTTYIAEGEKDADRLWLEGIPTTCNPMGAGKWRDEYTEQLMVAGVENIVILPDNDEAGARHGSEVAASCIKAGLKVKIVDLPGLPKGGDVSDWVEAGYTQDELAEIVGNTPALTKAPDLQAEKKLNVKNNAKDSTKSGRPLILKEVEPWPEDVDGAVLLDELVTAFKRYLALPGGAAEAMALWVVHTYALDAFQISPRLAFISPEKRCGKTTALSIIGCLVARPLPASNITPAAVFRTLDAASPTLIIDEADTFLGDNEELRGILNSGHHRANAQVIRLVGDKHEPRAFSTWGAVTIAKIKKLHGTLADRSVTVEMRRRRPDEMVERFRLDKTDDLNVLARKIARWTVDNIDILKKSDPIIPDAMTNDRAADNWRPLLAIADACGTDWAARARNIAMMLSNESGDDENSYGVLLLSDIHAIFEERQADRIFTSDILEALSMMEERPWPELNRGKPITDRKLAKLLSDYKITPKSIRIDDKTAKGYKSEDFQDAFARYLPPQSVTPSQPLETLSKPEIPIRHTDNNVTDKKPPIPVPILNCDGVTDQKGVDIEREHLEEDFEF